MSIFPSSQKRTVQFTITTCGSTETVLLPRHDDIFLFSLRLRFQLKQLCAVCFFSSDVHHLAGARDPAQRRPAAAGQPGDLPGRQPVLLPPPGPQTQEDVSRPRRG